MAVSHKIWVMNLNISFEMMHLPVYIWVFQANIRHTIESEKLIFFTHTLSPCLAFRLFCGFSVCSSNWNSTVNWAISNIIHFMLIYKNKNMRNAEETNVNRNMKNNESVFGSWQLLIKKKLLIGFRSLHWFL